MQNRLESDIEPTHWPKTGASVMWPIFPGWGDGPHDKDTSPQVDASGNYVLYHGTSMPRALKIIEQKILKHDDMGKVGVTTTPSEAATYGCMKAVRDNAGRKPHGEWVVLQVVIDKNWLLAQDDEVHKVFEFRPWVHRISREGRNQWLIDAKEAPLLHANIYWVDGEPPDENNN